MTQMSTSDMSDSSDSDEDNEVLTFDDLLRQWRSTCTLGSFPSKCPICQARVKICHMNWEDDAVFTCVNVQVIT